MDFLKRHRRLFIISIVAVCVAMMIITTVNQQHPTVFGNAVSRMTAPLQSGFSAAGNWIAGRIDFFANMSDLFDENQRLKNENALLKIDNSRLNQAVVEYAELAELLNTSLKYADYPTVVARVVAVSPGNWYNRFIIDRGSSHGIKKNMVVLADGSLIGRVTQVWSHSARVESIIDDASGVSAKVARTSDIGNLRGDVDLMVDGMCLMEFTSLDVDIVVGDDIQTSQISSVYPPGISIGRVTEVFYAANGMISAVVKPYADFSQVEYVLIITKLYDVEAGD